MGKRCGRALRMRRRWGRKRETTKEEKGRGKVGGGSVCFFARARAFVANDSLFLVARLARVKGRSGVHL